MPQVSSGAGEARLPAAMHILGWAGVLPFAALSVAGWVPLAPSAVIVPAFLTYSALILSFLGGVRWGRALAGGGGAPALLVAVLPSLWAWPAVAWLDALPACGWLALGFALQAWLDVFADPTPAHRSYRRLRAGLSLAVLACHGLFALALVQGRLPA